MTSAIGAGHVSQLSPALTVLAAFLCAHPLGSGIASTVAAFTYRRRRDPSRWYLGDAADVAAAKERYPSIAVVIPAHNEQEVIADALRAVLTLRWPSLEILVVDDGSTDDTCAQVRPFLDTGQVRLVVKRNNEGKSMAINDALMLARSELILILDADGIPDPGALERMVPPFLLGDGIGAVTGNPRVLNTRTVLSRLQAVEFSSTVGVLRRGEAVWGRLMTFSGLCTLLNRQVVLDLGGFAADMATEDIEMSWRLQLTGREVMYEPTALFGMQVPEHLRQLWRQRVRWVTGLAQVLRRHGWKAASPQQWRLWPTAVSGALSIVWAHLLVATIAGWAIATALGHPPTGLSLVMGIVAAVTVLAGVVQACIGMHMDARADPNIWKQLPWVAWYPLVYWVLCVLLVVRGTLPALFRRPRQSVWNVPREVGAHSDTA
jgi:biofilm PGA synthesis N-glycosyltransferase PgaC